MFFLSGFCGCQPGKEAPSSKVGSLKSKESGNSFPDFLVGTWKANKDRWIFNFERDGSISSFTHPAGMKIDVDEGGLMEQWRRGAVALYELGPCEAVYTPATRQLDVTIIIRRFQINFPNGQLSGNFVDYLKGQVSKDGKRWEVSWLSYATIDGSRPPDPNEIRPIPLTFTKIQKDG